MSPTRAPTSASCSAIMEADVSEIEGAVHGHADLDCTYSVVGNEDYIRAVPTAWCAKIHCDDCPSGDGCPNPSAQPNWSAAKCHSESLNMLGFATRKQGDAVHCLDWVIPSSSRLETFEAAPGAQVKFEWSGYHNVYLMPSAEAAELCDFSSATNLGSSSPITYTIPESAQGTVSFACEVGSHCANGQRLNINVTSVNHSKAEAYYQEALQLWPENCGAMGYAAELYMTMGDHSASLSMMDTLCNTCGSTHRAGDYARAQINAAAGVSLPASCATTAAPSMTPHADGLLSGSGSTAQQAHPSLVLALLCGLLTALI